MAVQQVTLKREASAVWEGGLKDGKGRITAKSGVLADVPYSVPRRFENEPGTNPEELIAAAHAACFSMALSAQLGNAGLTPRTIRTSATVSLDKLEGGWAVTGVHLQTAAKVPGADRAAFEKAAEAAKAGCPISRLLKAPITLEAKLEG